MIDPLIIVYGAPVVLFVVVMFIKKWQAAEARRVKLEAYSRLPHNIYVRSLSMDDTTVFERAQEERKLLIESGNRTKTVVHEIYFQDGIRPNASNESWEEFLAYCGQFERSDREKRNRWLNSQGRAWYLKNVKHQKGVKMPEPKTAVA